MNAKKLYNSAEETQALAKEILDKYPSVRVFCLYGDLGSGKTTFTQGMAREFGVDQRVTSPTFLMVKPYRVMGEPKGGKIETFYHLDLYRTESKYDLQGLGVDEILGEEKNIVVIEWPERLGEMLPKKRVDIKFSFISEHVREIEVMAVV